MALGNTLKSSLISRIIECLNIGVMATLKFFHLALFKIDEKNLKKFIFLIQMHISNEKKFIRSL